MAVQRDDLGGRILSILRQSSQPLKARDIVAALRDRFGQSVTTTEVNSLLYGQLSDSAAKDDEHCWSLNAAQPTLFEAKRPAQSTPNDSTTAAAAPNCPECGSPMRLRTAKRGPNAGGQFWGCSDYPNCTATIDFSQGVSSGGNGATVQCSPLIDDLPRRFPATPCSGANQAVLFECIALPKAAVAAVASDGLPLPWARSLSQWQLDLPLPQTDPGRQFGPWFAVVEKILKRGHLLTVSPTLEDEIRLLVDTNEPTRDEEWTDALTNLAQAQRPAPPWVDGFGSREEHRFFSDVLASRAPIAAGWLLRQVPLDSLSPSPDCALTNRRIDFLVAHPAGVHLAIEIDGAQHSSQTTADEDRDEELRKAGFDVVRVPAHEVRSGGGPEIDQVRARLASLPRPPSLPPCASFVQLIRRAHQVQVALWQAVAMGVVPVTGEHPVKVNLQLGADDDPELAGRFADAVLTDLNALIADVASVYGEEQPVLFFQPGIDPDIRVSFAPSMPLDNETLYIRDVYLPVTIATDLVSFAPCSGTAVDRIVCERLLHRIFGFAEFREGQFEAVERCLRGKDAIVLLPTGAGKSIAFQLAALLRPGACIVIDPILSLIEDQIDNLKAFGIDRTCQISTAIEAPLRRAVLDLLARGEYLFCYVAPERFQARAFRDSLRILTTHNAISLVAIDEAHCVSEWGHDFRPAYLNIARISRDYCATNGVAPPLMALTGTASRAVLKDVQRELEIDDFDAIITPKTFDRAELRFSAMPCRSDEKMLRLRGILESLPRKFGHTSMTFFDCRGSHTQSGLVFCPWVNGEFGVVRVSEELARGLNRAVPFYSGGAPKGIQESKWQNQKRHIASDFKRNRLPLMACTKAFGMGIDKPNIRYTVHYGLPSSIESFYQEAGRAGRDRRTAYCALLFSNDYPDRTKRLLNPSLQIDALQEAMKEVDWNNSDDITRALWFHARAFAGVRDDYEQLLEVMVDIGDLSRPRDVIVGFDRAKKEEKLLKERAIHRLLTIGAVSDYTVDYSAGEFAVRLSGRDKEQIVDCLYRYVAAYQRDQAKIVAERIRRHLARPFMDFVKIVGRELIVFVYEVIERSRRQALSEILALCEQCRDEASMRKRLLDYLGTSVFTESVEVVLEAGQGGLTAVLEVLEQVRSALDASQLRGESGRALESYPDHAGLRLLRAVSEAMTSQPNADSMAENVEACVKFAVSKYGLDLDLVCDRVMQAIQVATDPRPALAGPLIEGLVRGSGNMRLTARKVLSELPSPLAEHAIGPLIAAVNDRLTRILQE